VLSLEAHATVTSNTHRPPLVCAGVYCGDVGTLGVCARRRARIPPPIFCANVEPASGDEHGDPHVLKAAVTRRPQARRRVTH
jgi:hypothetical protein